MMKTLIAILATCLLWPLAVQQKPDREQAQLHGPVKSVESYLVDFQLRDGRTEESNYRQDGSLKQRVIYTYDGKGTEIDRSVLRGGGVAPSETVISFYDNIYDPSSKLRGTLAGKPSVEIESDSHGNWTKKTYLIQTSKGEKPQPYRAEVRVITYH